jgi:NAD(P)-dependent dehydrogenase (short-subunit alcohol dehydrogenase family)
VVVADVNRELGEALAGEVGGTFISLDVSDPEAWTSIPPVDYAFLNAGTMTKATPCSLEDLTLPSWSKVRSVNADGVVNGLLHLLPTMQAGGGGSIVLSGSMAGLASYPPDPFYAATKALVISLARSIGDSVAETSVRVNALCPGEAGATGRSRWTRWPRLQSRFSRAGAAGRSGRWYRGGPRSCGPSRPFPVRSGQARATKSPGERSHSTRQLQNKRLIDTTSPCR